MKSHLIRWINAALGGLGLRLVRSDSTEDVEGTFHSWHYLRHNARRLEHLASLQIPIRGKSVLEIGAGIGDHSSYYLDRGCTVTSRTRGRRTSPTQQNGIRIVRPTCSISSKPISQAESIDSMTSCTVTACCIT